MSHPTREMAVGFCSLLSLSPGPSAVIFVNFKPSSALSWFFFNMQYLSILHKLDIRAVWVRLSTLWDVLDLSLKYCTFSGCQESSSSVYAVVSIVELPNGWSGLQEWYLYCLGPSQRQIVRLLRLRCNPCGLYLSPPLSFKVDFPKVDFCTLIRILNLCRQFDIDEIEWGIRRWAVDYEWYVQPFLFPKKKRKLTQFLHIPGQIR